MFVLDEREEQKHEFWWNVEIRKPVDRGYRVHTFQVKFLMLPQDRIDDLLEGVITADEEADGVIDDAEDKITNTLLHEVIRDWKDVFVMVDGEKVEAKLEPEMLDKFLNITYWRSAVVRAYFDILSGTKKTSKRRRKN